MSGDLKNPTQDRTVHVDRYSGRVLAEAAFADYPLLAKAMAVGIALHQGDLGLWNAVLNVLFCLAIVFLCVSGVVIWWKRRPQGGLGVPPLRHDLPKWKTAMVIMLGLAIAFPLVGASLIVVWALDRLLLSRLFAQPSRV